jgi:hypothetical protein
MASLGKERAVSPTLTKLGSMAAIIKKNALLLKKGVPKVLASAYFYGDRAKFQIYVLQV